MRTWQKITVAILAAVALSGCGKNPAAAPEAERTMKQRAGLKGAKTVAQPAARSASTLSAPTRTGAPAKTPGVSAKPGSTPASPSAPAKPGTTAPSPSTPGASAPATGDGALRLVIRTWGADPVGSLVLNVFSQVDPAQSAEVPLKLSGPEARWEQSDVPAGRYTIRVKALSATGAPMGVASTEAIVEPNAMTDLTIDLGIDTPTPTPKPSTNTGGQSGATGGEPTASPSPTPTPAASPAGPGYGGTLGVRVEIL